MSFADSDEFLSAVARYGFTASDSQRLIAIVRAFEESGVAAVQSQKDGHQAQKKSGTGPQPHSTQQDRSWNYPQERYSLCQEHPPLQFQNSYQPPIFTTEITLRWNSALGKWEAA